MPLEPTTQQFIDGLVGAPPTWSLGAAAARQGLTDLQPRPVPLAPADVTDTTWPVGPTGETRIRVVRPEGATGALPLLMYFHGGGWVPGDQVSHDRLVREIAAGVHATVVFVDHINSPDAKYPTQNEQAYAAKLARAGARVTSVRYDGTIHDFAVPNPLADTPAARGAIQQAITALRAALHA